MTFFNIISPKWPWLSNKATTFCGDRMSGSYFIAQTRKFLLIDAAAVTLGLGHGKVIWYISPDLYILCPKYLRFSSNSFDVIGKSHWGRRWGGRGRCGGNKLKTQSHPDLGDLTMIWCISEQFGVYHVMTLLRCFYPNKMSTISHCYVSASWLQLHILPCSSSRTLVSWKSRRWQGSVLRMHLDPGYNQDCKHREVSLWFTENIDLRRWMDRSKYQ